MNKEEMQLEFQKNVEYLQRNIPPDDIYLFAEQTFMAAVFFIFKWAEWADVRDEADKCPITKKWLTNILSLKIAREKGIDLNLDLDIKSVEDDEDNPGG